MFHLSEQAKQRIGQQQLVSVEEFYERLWKMNPIGNPENTYIEVLDHVTHQKTFTGEPVTLDLIIGKYKEYLEMAHLEQREQRMIKRILGFVRDRMYNNTYEGGVNPLRDRYL